MLKFSGKELDEITGLYDHGARNRNPITAVWYGIDELFEKYPENGPYGYCGGNPVKFVDLDGRSFSPELEKMAKTYEKLLTKEIASYEKKLNNSKLSSQKIESYTSCINDLRDTLKEINILRESCQEYDYKYFDNTTLGDGNGQKVQKLNGSLTYENGKIIVNVERGDIILFAHELKHAYQFEIGKLSIWDNKNIKGIPALYDIIDEIEAYTRQTNFGEEKITYETSGVDYSALIKYRSNIRFAPSGKSEGFYINCSLKSLKNQIFRVNGTTYHNGKAFNQNIHKE